MAITPTQRAVYIDEVRAAYDAYQHSKRAVETKIRAEIEARIAAEHGSILLELSKLLHEYHRKGLSKKALRVATRKYGNADEFAKMWDVYQPEDSFTLAAGRSANPDYEFKDGVLYWYKWNDGSNLENPFVITDYSTYSDFVYIPDQLDIVMRDYGNRDFYNSATKAVKDAFARGLIEPREGAHKRYQAGEITNGEYASLQTERESVNGAWADYKEGDK